MVKMSIVWDRSAEFIGDNFRAILPVVFVSMFVPSVILGALAPIGTDEEGGVSASFGLLQFGFMLLSMWGSLYLSVLALNLGGERGAGSVALNRLPAILVVSIVITIAIALITAAFFAALMLISGADFSPVLAGNDMALSAGQNGVVALGGLVFLLGLLWLIVRLTVIAPVILQEQLWLGALRRSFSLTRGYALRIFGVLLLYGVVAIVAMLAASVVFGSIFTLLFGAGSGGVSLSGFLTSIVSAAVQTIFTVIAGVFTAKLYLALTQSSEPQGNLATK